MPKANPKVAEVEPKDAPILIVEDSVEAPKEPAKPVTVTELPNGIKIEDY